MNRQAMIAAGISGKPRVREVPGTRLYQVSLGPEIHLVEKQDFHDMLERHRKGGCGATPKGIRRCSIHCIEGAYPSTHRTVECTKELYA